MSISRIDRVNELLQREIASSLYRLQFDPPLDLARVTISQVLCSPDLRQARVFVSVLLTDDPEEGRLVIRQLMKQRKELQRMLADNIVLKYTPHLQFMQDDSQDSAARVLQILDALPPPAAEPPKSDESPET